MSSINNPVVETPSTTSNGASGIPATASTVPGTALPLTTSVSLYVGDLGQFVAESHLFELFNMVGPVESIRVCRDSTTRHSLGYAYVNYRNPVDAERAIETLNHTVIQGKPCRVMYSLRNSSSKRDEAGNVFIKNLDKSIDNKALQDTFAAFGKILSCKVASDNGISRGYGFVQFEKSDDADTAIKSVNGMMLNDQIVYVARHESAKERKSKSDLAHSNFTNVYVKGFTSDVTKEELEALFNPHGKVTSCVIETDADGKSKKFGFVNFEEHSQALAAINAVNDLDFKGGKLYVSRAQNKNERTNELIKNFQAAKEEKKQKSEGCNLYFKNFDDSSIEDIRSAFSNQGTITSFMIKVDANGKSRGFGFVCFSSPTEANKAISEINNSVIGAKPLFVTHAQSREERNALLESQRINLNPMAGNAPMYPNSMGFYPPNNNYGPSGPMNMMYGQPSSIPPRPHWNNVQFMAPQFGPNSVMGGPQGHMPSPSNRPPRQPRMNNNHSGSRVNNNRSNYNNPSSGQQPRQPMPAAPQVAPEAAPVATSETGLTAAALAAATPTDQKQMLGEHLFPLIHAHNEEHAGKITGMLLEMDNAELLYLLENADARKHKIDEALNVLMQHAKNAS